MPKIHFPKLPHAQHEIQRMTAFSPHEKYFHSRSQRGRFTALAHFVIGVVRYPIEVPFWMMINTALLVKKVGQLIFNTAALVSFSKKRVENVKKYSVEALDLLCLLPLIPVMRACSVFRSLAAAIIHPGLYYRSPSRCTQEQQAQFYQKQAEDLFQKSLLTDGLAKDLKQSVWNLKKQMKRCLQKKPIAERIILAKACGLAVIELDGKIDAAKLNQFKEVLDREEK